MGAFTLARQALEFSRKHGVTLYVTLLAAYQALLHRYTGATDFAVGGGVANRNDRAAEQVIGMIVNTVALGADHSCALVGTFLLRGSSGGTPEQDEDVVRAGLGAN